MLTFIIHYNEVKTVNKKVLTQFKNAANYYKMVNYF